MNLYFTRAGILVASLVLAAAAGAAMYWYHEWTEGDALADLNDGLTCVNHMARIHDLKAELDGHDLQMAFVRDGCILKKCAEFDTQLIATLRKEGLPAIRREHDEVNALYRRHISHHKRHCANFIEYFFFTLVPGTRP